MNVRLIMSIHSFFSPPQGQILKVAKDKSIENSNFNPKRKTKFIIHGFIDTPLSNWVKVSLSFYYSHIDAHLSFWIFFIEILRNRIVILIIPLECTKN